MADNSTGKERKALARWVFLAMAQHPEIESLSSASEADRAAGLPASDPASGSDPA